MECSLAQMYWSTMYLQFLDENHPMTLRERYVPQAKTRDCFFKKKLNSCRSDPEATKEVTFDDITSEVIYSFVPEDDSAKSLYWSLPTNFLGNKVRNLKPAASAEYAWLT